MARISREKARETKRQDLLRRLPGDRREDKVLTDDQKKARFLQILEKTRNIKRAASKLGLSAGIIRRWRRADPVFDAAVEEAWNDIVDDLEGVAMNLAVKGYQEPVFFNGECVGFKTIPVPSMQTFMLKAHRPDKYREHSEISISPEKFVEGVKRLVGDQDEVARRALIVDPIEVARSEVAKQVNEVRGPERGDSEFLEAGKGPSAQNSSAEEPRDPSAPRDPKKKTPRRG